MALMKHEKLYQEIKTKLHEILLHNVVAAKLITIGELMKLYYLETGTEMHSCGYDDEIRMLESMSDAIKIKNEPEKPSRVFAVILPEDANSLRNRVTRLTDEFPANATVINKPRENVRQIRERGSKTVLKSSSSEGEEDKTFSTLKADFRAILTTARNSRMSVDEIITSHRQTFGTPINKTYLELFRSMPDVMRPIPGTNDYKLVPSKNSAHVEKLIAQQKDNRPRNRKGFDDRNLSKMGAWIEAVLSHLQEKNPGGRNAIGQTGAMGQMTLGQRSKRKPLQFSKEPQGSWLPESLNNVLQKNN